MKGTRVGELEELILLCVGSLFDDAYGVAIQSDLKNRCDRALALSTVHVALFRLEEKGFIESRFDGATSERGGRRKRLYRVTKSGQRVLADVRSIRNQLWDSIPRLAFQYGPH